MAPLSYERYGLTGNPFRDLAAENIDDVELYHVNLQVDETIHNIKDEVFEKENKAVVALAGLHGSGKTERLRLAQSEAQQRSAFAVYVDVPHQLSGLPPAIAQAFQRSAKLGGFRAAFSPPAWYKGVAALGVKGKKPIEALTAGRAIAQALNENAPSFLLLNDLHNLKEPAQLNYVAAMMAEISDRIRPGVLVMFGCYPSYWINVQRAQPTYSSRINRVLALPTLHSEEAALLLAKKLLAKRLVENLEPTYPFDREAIAFLNEEANGNPRRLLELADKAMDYALNHRAYRVDIEAAKHAKPAPSVEPAARDGTPAPAPAGGKPAPPYLESPKPTTE
jgi:type II secretory pathway predicted ATPase ExeA